MLAHGLGWKLLGTVSVLGLMANVAIAQDVDEEFLGVIELGDSKREVQAGTATAITVINQEEIDDRQASTIAELIDSVPGVTLVNGNTPQGSGINIRGFGANGTYGTDSKVLVVVDGATTGAEELYRIGNQLFTDPELYREVSVIRGTVGSFEFGAGVIGGVVQLETKNASDFTGGEIGLRLRQTLEATSNGQGFASSTIAAWQSMAAASAVIIWVVFTVRSFSYLVRTAPATLTVANDSAVPALPLRSRLRESAVR